MKDKDKSKEQLIGELIQLRQQSARSESGRKSGKSIQSRPEHESSGIDEGEYQLRMVIAALPDVVLTINREGRYLKVMAQNNALLAAPDYELEGKLIREFLPVDIADRCLEIIGRTFDSRQGQIVEYELDVLGGHKWFEGRTSPLVEPDGTIHKILWIARDVTGRKEAESEIKTALEEKEVLLKEIRHRVNNNMQLVISLLNLQAGYITDPESWELFHQSRNRIWAMAIIHEMLYQSENLAKIDFERYIYSLTNNLFSQYSIKPGQIKLERDIRDVRLDVNKAIPCGLIINEIISICLNQSFPKNKTERGIRVTMRLSAEDEVELIVAGNGLSFPEEIESSSFGLELINTLAGQLGGALEVDRGDWTVFRISFQAH
jgi:PAS domain S-box-containing protein